MRPNKLLGCLAFALFVPSPVPAARAQESEVTVQPLPSAPPPPPPAQYPQAAPYPQAPVYAQPSPYPPQPQYTYPVAPYQRPPRPRAFREGDPVPPGYHVEEEPRSGLVVAGWTLLLVPYALSAVVALGVKGDNGSDWLYAPVVGPWALLANRTYNGCGTAQSESDNGLGCLADTFAVMGLIIDGLLQAAGTTLLFVGYLDEKPVLVRDEQPALRIAPMRVGSGHGLGLVWSF